MIACLPLMHTPRTPSQQQLPQCAAIASVGPHPRSLPPRCPRNTSNSQKGQSQPSQASADPALGSPEPALPEPGPPTFLGGGMSPAGRQAAQPLPGDLRQALGGGLLLKGAALPSEGLPPTQAELALSSGSRWGAALLVPRKAADTKNRQLSTDPTPSRWLAHPPQPCGSQDHATSTRRPWAEPDRFQPRLLRLPHNHQRQGCWLPAMRRGLQGP